MEGTIIHLHWQETIILWKPSTDVHFSQLRNLKSMDFFTLIIAYGLTFGIVSYILLLGDTSFHRDGIVGRVRHGFLQLVKWTHSNLLPRAIQDPLNRMINYLIHERNPCFQYFYIAVLLAVLYFYTSDVLPLALTVGTPPSLILATYFCFVSCFFLFIICCMSNPGIISQKTWCQVRDCYKADGLMYHKGVECSTCKLEKPARSKHCGTCNQCVYRFDHHCTWLNNCIGGLNTRYFLALVISLTFGTGFVSYSIGATLGLFAQKSGLMRASYVGSDGKVWPVTWKVAIQHLFMERPMPVFIMMSLALLCLLVAAFMFYHAYLVLTNQTTNERYKRSSITFQEICEPCTHLSTGRVKKGNNSQKLSYKRHLRSNKEMHHQSNIYNRGIISNIYEIVFPLCNRWPSWS